jgi:hypothetical protein
MFSPPPSATPPVFEAIPEAVFDLVRRLREHPPSPAVFNPWAQVDPENDAGPDGPAIRAEQLSRYLAERLGSARWLLIAEAVGYQGGHFSGIAMTSERILLGHLSARGIRPDDVIRGGGRRTSRSQTLPALGANEPTATIVWGALKAAGIAPREVVLWNAYAWHPMKSGWLTNRKPTDAEIRAGRPVLEAMLGLFPQARPVAIGRVAEELLLGMDVPVAARLRHPANGGAGLFRQGLGALVA